MLLKKTDLDKIDNNEPDNILKKVKKLNEDYELDIGELYVWSIVIDNKNFSIIQAKSTSTKYIGIAIVTYILKK